MLVVFAGQPTSHLYMSSGRCLEARCLKLPPPRLRKSARKRCHRGGRFQAAIYLSLAPKAQQRRECFEMCCVDASAAESMVLRHQQTCDF